MTEENVAQKWFYLFIRVLILVSVLQTLALAGSAQGSNLESGNIQIEDLKYDEREMQDFDTDPTCGGYGIFKDLGATAGALEWENDEDIDYIENDDILISFLNEYYIVYPKKLPKGQIK